MSGESNLGTLLENMKPDMREGAFVFLTSSDAFSEAVQKEAVMVFRELEGMTIIVRQELARTICEGVQPQWAMITLTVHSDLSAVGFLAAITERLAKAGISVNPVSAFYHDHLFVPWEKRDKAMKVLHSFGK